MRSSHGNVNSIIEHAINERNEHHDDDRRIGDNGATTVIRDIVSDRITCFLIQEPSI